MHVEQATNVNIYRSERDTRGIFYTGIQTTGTQLTMVELCGELDDMSRPELRSLLPAGAQPWRSYPAIKSTVAIVPAINVSGGDRTLRFMSTAEELRSTDVRRKVALRFTRSAAAPES